MHYLTIEEILLIHFSIITEFQPYQNLFNIVNPDGLESAIGRPQQTFGGEDVHQEIFSKAAALTHSLTENHPFQDGNKRVGITAGCVFLLANGYSTEVSDDEIYTAAMNTSNGIWKVPELKDWFERHFC